MTNLSLGITTCDLTPDSLVKVQFLVFLGPHELYVLDEHSEMDSPWQLMRVGQCSIYIEVVVVQSLIYLPNVVVVDHGQISVCILDDLQPAFVVDVGSVGEDWSLLKVACHVSVIPLSIEEVSQSLRRQLGIFSFLLEKLLDAHH